MPTVDLGSVVGPQGPQGVQGPQGPQGIQGETGPNAVSAETNTNLTGLLYGNGSKVGTKEITDTPTSGSGALLTSGGAYDALQTMVRPNLLDNAYFVGGGSQQGGGQFPINQRAGYVVPDGVTYYSDYTLTTSAGTTSAYTTAVYVNTTYGTIDVGGTTYYVAYGDMVAGYAGRWIYCIDRWVKPGISGRVLLHSNRLEIGDEGIDQSFENVLPHSTYTMSILFSNNVLLTATATYEGAEATIFRGVGSLLFYDNHLAARIQPGASNIISVKLELGDTQTLAHQENGVWVLNEIPNFQQELAKCQRYYYRINARDNYSAFGVGADVGDGCAIQFVHPVQMRAVPTLALHGSFAINSEVYSAATYAFDSRGIDMAFVYFTPGATLQRGASCVLQANNDPSAYIAFDADL